MAMAARVASITSVGSVTSFGMRIVGATIRYGMRVLLVETLIASPVPRMQLLLAKYAAVVTVAEGQTIEAFGPGV